MKKKFKVLISLILTPNFFEKIIKFKVDLYTWRRFIFSLITFKKKFHIYSLESWHLGSHIDERKKYYIKTIESQNNVKVIELDLNNVKMLKFFILYLKYRSLYSSNYKKILKLKLSDDFINYSDCFNFSMWDLYIRTEKFYNRKVHLPTNSSDYKKIFDDRKFKLSLKKYKKLMRLVFQDSVELFFFVSQGYADWICASFFAKYSRKIVFFESQFGMLSFSNNKKGRIHERISKYLLLKKKEISNKELLEAEKNLANRVKGNYSSKHLFYMKRHNAVIRPPYKFESYKDNAILIFLHAFTDAPNKRIDKKFKFIDFYHSFLHVLEYCRSKKRALYIKPHPNRFDFLSEQIYLETVKNIVKQEKLKKSFHIEFIDGQLDQIDLLKFKNLIAVTGRGSVILECGFLGIPIINTFPEYNDFSFCIDYQNFSCFDEAIKYCEIAYDKAKAKTDSIYSEALREKIVTESLFEFKNISKETKKKNTLSKPLLDEVNYI